MVILGLIWYSIYDYDGDTHAARYVWGYLIVRFLFEEHPEVMLELYDFANDPPDSCSKIGEEKANDYVNETFPSLADDFDRWLKGFVSFKAVRMIEPLTLFLSLDENGTPRDPNQELVRDDEGFYIYDPLDYDYAGYAYVRLDPYIQTTRRWDLSVTYSLSSDAVGGMEETSPAEILRVVPTPIG